MSIIFIQVLYPSLHNKKPRKNTPRVCPRGKYQGGTNHLKIRDNFCKILQ